MGQSFSTEPIGGRELTRKEEIAAMLKFWILMQPEEADGSVPGVPPWFRRGPVYQLRYPAKLNGFRISLTGAQPTASFLIRAKRQGTGEWDRIFCANDVQLGKIKCFKLEDNVPTYTSIHVELFVQTVKVKLEVFGRVVGPETPLLMPPVDLVQAGNGGIIISCSRDPLDASRLIHPDPPSKNDGWYVSDKPKETEEFIIISLSGPSIINHTELINPDPECAIKVFGFYSENSEAGILNDWVKLCGSMMDQTYLPVHTNQKTQAPFRQAWTHLLVCFFPGVSISRVRVFGWTINRPHAKNLTDQELKRNITYGFN